MTEERERKIAEIKTQEEKKQSVEQQLQARMQFHEHRHIGT
jgi:transcriptional regulator of NAD metabolism